MPDDCKQHIAISGCHQTTSLFIHGNKFPLLGRHYFSSMIDRKNIYQICMNTIDVRMLILRLCLAWIQHTQAYNHAHAHECMYFSHTDTQKHVETLEHSRSYLYIHIHDIQTKINAHTVTYIRGHTHTIHRHIIYIHVHRYTHILQTASQTTFHLRFLYIYIWKSIQLHKIPILLIPYTWIILTALRSRKFTRTYTYKQPR